MSFIFWGDSNTETYFWKLCSILYKAILHTAPFKSSLQYTFHSFTKVLFEIALQGLETFEIEECEVSWSWPFWALCNLWKKSAFL